MEVPDYRRRMDGRLILAAVGVALAAFSVLLHLFVRYAVGSLYVPWLLPRVQDVVAISLCATLLPLSRSRDSDSRHAPIAALVACIAVTLAFALLQAGAAGVIETVHAVRLALTSQEVFGLAPAGLAGAITARKLLGGGQAHRDIWTSTALLFLPSPLFPLLSLVSPGNEQSIARVLLPVALVAAAALLIAGRRRGDLPPASSISFALFGSVLLFYGPVIRGIAGSGEAAILSLLGLAVFSCLYHGVGSDTPAAIAADLRDLGLVVLALITGVALHHVIGLLWLVDRGSPPIFVPIAGVALTIGWIMISHRAKNCVAATCALAAPLVVAPAMSFAFVAAARSPSADGSSEASWEQRSGDTKFPIDQWTSWLVEGRRHAQGRTAAPFST
jgi:hypothetical protein